MKKLVAAGFMAVVLAEAIALVSPDRRFVLAISGVAVAWAVLTLRWYLLRESGLDDDEPPTDEAAESLRRWLSRTEALVSRAEATRKDWDRHLRPMLARQYELATGQRRTKDKAAYHATGQMLFGTDLWEWVDPENVARGSHDEPGPGRDALDEILQRLERV